MKLKNVLLLALLILSINISNGQSFVIDDVVRKEYMGVSSLPGHGYAFVFLKEGQFKIEIKDLAGNDLTELTVPQKIIRFDAIKEEKPKVYFNGTSYCVVSIEKKRVHTLYAYDLQGQKTGLKNIDGKIYNVYPIQNGYVIGYGTKSWHLENEILDDNLKTKWKVAPSLTEVSSYTTDFILSAGENISNQKVIFPFLDNSWNKINSNFRYSNPVDLNGKEDRYLFLQENYKGGDKSKNRGIVCFDKDGKVIFKDFYDEKMRKLLQARSYGKDIIVLFRKYPSKGALTKSFAEIVKYNAKGEKVHSIEIDGDKFPVQRNAINFFIEKTSEGYALLADTRGHFYSLFLNNDLGLIKQLDFDGPSYGKNNKPPKMSAIASIPERSLFSGITSENIPYLVFLNAKIGDETARCTSFDGKDLISAPDSEEIESRIADYYRARNSVGLTNTLVRDYGTEYTLHDIYSNLVHMGNKDSFMLITYLESKKQIIVKEFSISN